MKNFFLLLVILCFSKIVLAQDNNLQLIEKDIESLLQNIIEDNNKVVTTEPSLTEQEMAKTQKPRATVVTCSDSRVQSTVIDDSALGDLFFIRNIGNQVETAKGSIEYGVRHLKTPVLLIIGHVNCGAIKAALSDYSSESKAIQKELNTIKLKKHISSKEGVIENVHHQVEVALKEFAKEVKDKKLLIVGAVYDFGNEHLKGYNRLIIVDVDGEKNSEQIRKNNHFKNLTNVQIGVEEKH